MYVLLFLFYVLDELIDRWRDLDTAFARNPINGTWYNYDDSRVSECTSLKEVVSNAAYLLFYVRRGKHWTEEFKEEVQSVFLEKEVEWKKELELETEREKAKDTSSGGSEFLFPLSVVGKRIGIMDNVCGDDEHVSGIGSGIVATSGLGYVDSNTATLNNSPLGTPLGTPPPGIVEEEDEEGTEPMTFAISDSEDGPTTYVAGGKFGKDFGSRVAFGSLRDGGVGDDQPTRFQFGFSERTGGGNGTDKENRDADVDEGNAGD